MAGSSSNIDNLLVSTPIDAFIKLIHDEGEVDLNYASQKLNIPISTLEEWSSILQSEGVIDIKYGLYKVIAKWKQPEKEVVEKKAEKLKEVKEEKKKEGENLLGEVKDAKKGTSEAEKYIKEAVTSLNNTLDDIKKVNGQLQDLTEYKEKYRQVMDEVDSLLSKVQIVQDDLAVMKQDVSSFIKELNESKVEDKLKEVLRVKSEIDIAFNRVSEMEKKINETKKSLSALSDKADELKDAARMVEEVYELKDKVDEIKKGYLEDFFSLKSQLISELELKKKEVESLKEELNTAPTDAEHLEALLEKKKKLEDDLENLAFSLQSLEDALPDIGPSNEEEIKKLDDKVEELADKLSSLGDLDSVVENIENVDKLLSDLNELSFQLEKQKETFAKEVGDLMATVDDEIETYKNYPKIKEHILVALDKYAKELTEMNGELKSLEEKASSLEEGFTKTLEKVKDELESPNIKNAMNKIDTILQNLKTVEEKYAELKSLRMKFSKLERSVQVLIKQVELLHMMVEPPKAAPKSETMQVEDFEEKKAKVKDMLMKLWGGSSSSDSVEGSTNESNIKKTGKGAGKKGV